MVPALRPCPATGGDEALKQGATPASARCVGRRPTDSTVTASDWMTWRRQRLRFHNGKPGSSNRKIIFADNIDEQTKFSARSKASWSGQNRSSRRRSGRRGDARSTLWMRAERHPAIDHGDALHRMDTTVVNPRTLQLSGDPAAVRRAPAPGRYESSWTHPVLRCAPLIAIALILGGFRYGNTRLDSQEDGVNARETSSLADRVSLSPCKIAAPAERDAQKSTEADARCGTFLVPENRRTGSRMLPLRVIIIPARSLKPRPPIFFLSGGPGQAATESAPFYVDSWTRDDHDVVLADLRGTGEGTRLDCHLGGSDDNPQSYLEPLFAEGAGYAKCRDELSRVADLTQYTTPIAMQDLDELRRALGYGQIILEGGSYGTRAALTYIRLFGGHVYAALLSSLSPIENRAPLHHAAAAQRAFDVLVQECQADKQCRAAFPDSHGDLRTVLSRLQRAPAVVKVPHPLTGASVSVRVTASAFADGLRVMLYSASSGRSVPLLLQRARRGDLVPFAEAAIRSSRSVVQSLRLGLLLSVSCSEDVWRIRPYEVERETKDTFTGAARLRGQMAACAAWPRGEVSEQYYRPFRSNVPTLLISGNLDPVTPPMWGEVMRRYLPNSVHVVSPGGHAPYTKCIEALSRQLAATGRAKSLDVSCIADEANPPFVLVARGDRLGRPRRKA
jgi:pimeloyl-ACP methyl ester carboxylesterase